MAQLSDDCFAFGGPMMSVDEAVRLIAARVAAVLDVETVALTDADGRILAHEIAAPLPLPPFTNSAVDGYAVASRDLLKSSEQPFAIAGRVQAGSAASEPIRPGHAMRIFTGAPMPEGADTVFMQEDVRVEDEKVVLPAGLKPGANVRPVGEDIPFGHPALKAGQRLRPQHVALAAAFGLTQLDVIRRIRVAIFSTGNELVSPGESRAAAQLFDSNRFMLAAMLRRLGCDRHRPFARIDHAGLLWLLNGAKLVDLSEDAAIIEWASGARQTFRRRAVAPGSVVLAWELMP